MHSLYRRLAGVALASSSVAIAAASYVREGINPLAILPTLGTPAPWQAAQTPLTALSALCVVLAIAGCSFARVRSERTLFALGIGALAAVATYSYDACADAGLAWLPQFGGCHCWLTGAAALLGAALTALIVFVFGLCAVRIVAEFYAPRPLHVRRRLARAHARRVRPRISRLDQARLIPLLAFRGPPRPAAFSA